MTPQALVCLKTGEEKPDDLTRLLSALQASLFFWCQCHLSTEEESKEEVNTKAVSRLITRCKLGFHSLVGPR